MNKIISTYRNLLKNNMGLVQVLQTGVLMGSGDLIAQIIIEKRSFKQYEPIRTAQFFVLGTCLVGPSLSVWYRVLAKQFGDTGTGTAVVLKKVAVDQLLFAPIFTAIIVTSINLMQGKEFEQIKREMKAKYLDILISNYKLWPAVQLINFHFVPLKHQVLVVQMVALFWNAYISWKTQLKLD